MSWGSEKNIRGGEWNLTKTGFYKLFFNVNVMQGNRRWSRSCNISIIKTKKIPRVCVTDHTGRCRRRHMFRHISKPFWGDKAFPQIEHFEVGPWSVFPLPIQRCDIVFIRCCKLTHSVGNNYASYRTVWRTTLQATVQCGERLCRLRVNLLCKKNPRKFSRQSCWRTYGSFSLAAPSKISEAGVV